jgi:polyhydroxyalkanoate synthesis regulator phasin
MEYKAPVYDPNFFRRTPEENIIFFFGPTLTLKYEKNVADAIIEHVGKICEVTIENGVVKAVKPWKTVEEVLEEFKKKHESLEEPKLKTIRDKMRVILSVIMDLTKTGEPVEREKLLNVLEKEYTIERTEAMKLINQLIQEGAISEPKIGFYQKT